MTTPKTSAPIHEGDLSNSLMLVHNIYNHESPRLLCVLFDSVGARTMIHRRALPNGVNTMWLDKKMRMTTVAGFYESVGEVLLQNIRLPELDKNRIVNNQIALVFDSDCRYNMILGSDLLQRSGIDIKYSTGRVEWFGNNILLREAPRVETYEEYFKIFIDDYLSHMEDE